MDDAHVTASVTAEPSTAPGSAKAPAHLDRAAFAPVDWSLFCAIGVIWGSSYLLIKLALDTFHPGLITWARVASGAGALLILRGGRTEIAPADRGRVVLLSIVWVGIPFTLFPLAEQHINSAVTGLLTGATPFFTGLFGALWFSRPPRGPQRLGMIVGFLGIIMISIGSSAEGGTAPLGVAMVLVATLGYGLATNLAGPLQHRYGAVPLMRRMLALATLWTAPLGLVGLARSTAAPVPIAATLALGVVGTGLAFALMTSLVGRVGGNRASFITYLIPLVALVLGAAFLEESVTAAALAGAGLILAASVLASRAEV